MKNILSRIASLLLATCLIADTTLAALLPEFQLLPGRISSIPNTHESYFQEQALMLVEGDIVPSFTVAGKRQRRREANAVQTLQGVNENPIVHNGVSHATNPQESEARDHKEFRNRFGRRMKLFREKLKMSQGSLGHATDKWQTDISNMELGKGIVSFNDAQRLADALGTSILCLAGAVEPGSPLAVPQTFVPQVIEKNVKLLALQKNISLSTWGSLTHRSSTTIRGILQSLGKGVVRLENVWYLLGKAGIDPREVFHLTEQQRARFHRGQMIPTPWSEQQRRLRAALLENGSDPYSKQTRAAYALMVKLGEAWLIPAETADVLRLVLGLDENAGKYSVNALSRLWMDCGTRISDIKIMGMAVLERPLILRWIVEASKFKVRFFNRAATFDLNQIEIASLMNCTKQTLTNWKKNTRLRFPLYLLLNGAEVLQTNIDWLVLGLSDPTAVLPREPTTFQQRFVASVAESGLTVGEICSLTRLQSNEVNGYLKGSATPTLLTALWLAWALGHKSPGYLIAGEGQRLYARDRSLRALNPAA